MRKELLTSSDDASKKQESNRHDRGISIDTSRIHSNVNSNVGIEKINHVMLVSTCATYINVTA